MNQKDAYLYTNYIGNPEEARVMTAGTTDCLPDRSGIHMGFSGLLDSFNIGQRDDEQWTDFDDPFANKLEISKDRVSLVLGEITGRETLEGDNLKRLYDDLLRIDNWRLERPFTDQYQKDRTWLELNKMELQIREQIRREKKDLARDLAFPQKDFRNSLLEFKLQERKSRMLDTGGLEEEMGRGEIEPDGSYKQTGDIYRMQKLY